MENPLSSKAWHTEKLKYLHAEGSKYKLVRVDQCMVGLVGQKGLPIAKATALYTTNNNVKKDVGVVCCKSHEHVPGPFYFV